MTLEHSPIIFDNSEPIKLAEGVTIFGINQSSLKPIIENSLQTSFLKLKISSGGLQSTIDDNAVHISGDVVVAEDNFAPKTFHVNNIFNNGPNDKLVRDRYKSYSTYTDPGGSLKPEKLNDLVTKLDDIDSILFTPINDAVGEHQTLTGVKTWVEKVDGENMVLVQVEVEEEKPKLLIENNNHEKPELSLHPAGRDKVEIPLDQEHLHELLLALFKSELESKKIEKHLPNESEITINYVKEGNYFNFKSYEDWGNSFGDWKIFFIAGETDISNKLSNIKSDDGTSQYNFQDLTFDGDNSTLKLKKNS